jgi:hypothetical protein
MIGFVPRINKWRSRIDLSAYLPQPMVYILNLNTFIGLYNLDYFFDPRLI